MDIKEKSTSTDEQSNQLHGENQNVSPTPLPPTRRASTTVTNTTTNNENLPAPAAASNGHQQPELTQEQATDNERPAAPADEEREHTTSYNMRLRRNTNNNNQDQTYQSGYDLVNGSSQADDTQMQAPPGPPSRESAYVSMIAWSLDDTSCIIATTYGDLKVFDSHTGELLGTLVGHTEETYAVDVHPTDARTVLSAGYDGRAILWDLATFTQINCHYYPERNLLDCKFSKDGVYLLCSSY